MKRIIICADGTWNVRDQTDDQTGKRRPSNVTKLARAILPQAPDMDQVVIYHDGLGTSGGIDKYTGGAFGEGIERNVRDLYRSILYNYEEGDELFFFGFSRGAFTVRTLAGFMNLVGLLQKDDDYWLPEVYGCYENGYAKGSPQWAQAFRGVRAPQSRFPIITFIGVWDTVGALGAPGLLGQILNKNKYQYHDISLNDRILNAAQALAIDEQRKPFAPSVWTRPAGWKGSLQQAWFPGCHTDVGGGSPRDGLANEALHWIVQCAEACGLAVDKPFLTPYLPCVNGNVHDSMSLEYRLFGPLVRPIGTTDAASEGLHRATLDRIGMSALSYTPQNVVAYQAAGGNRVYDTARVPRGTPCV